MAGRRSPCTRHTARPPAPPGLRARGYPQVAPQPVRRAPQPPARRSLSWLGRRRRERLRIFLDHLLHILLQPHQHLLLDVDIEVDLDRFVRRLDRDATCKRKRCRQRGELQRDRGSFHLVPPGGGDCLGGAPLDTGLGCDCCSCLVVLRTSTLSAGESTGNGMTGAITWVGSLKALPIWMSARNGALMFTFRRSGSLLKAERTSPASRPWLGPSETWSTVSRVANSPARSPSRRMIIVR